MFVRTLTRKGGSGCGRLAIGKICKHLLFRFGFMEGGWEIVYRYNKQMYLRRIGSFYRTGGQQIPRLYMDGWRDGLNRLWRDGVTILPRPAKQIATAKNNRPVPALEKKKTPPRPVPSKKNPAPSRLGKKPPAPSRLGKKQQPPRPASKPPRPAPSRHEQQNTPSRGWKLETNTTACLFFSLSCCAFISYCSLVRSIL